MSSVIEQDMWINILSRHEQVFKKVRDLAQQLALF